MTPREAKAYLHSFINYELKSDCTYHPDLKLDRVYRLCELIGHPQKKIKTIHVAGTKGKGSTCVLTAYILRAAGYRVGLFTSPHFNDERERIRVLDPKGTDRKDVFEGKISEFHFCHVLEMIKPAIEAVKNDPSFKAVTFFEIYTAMAFYYFEKERVDFAVLETGLGGRLDATNVCDSLVCAITPISLEHTKQLGTTLKEIAQEKAAIIKDQRQIAVVAPQEKEVRSVIEERCHELGIPSLWVDQDIHGEFIAIKDHRQKFDIQGTLDVYRNLQIPLLGRHQIMNACMAVGIIEALTQIGFSLDLGAIKEGLKDVRWPGRFEIIRENPFIILDSAHNPGSCRVLAETIKELFPHKKVTLILAVSSDKDVKGICQALEPICDDVILTKADHPRALDFSKPPRKELFGNKKCVIKKNIRDALNTALKNASKGQVILIAGSIFIVAQARAILSPSNVPPRRDPAKGGDFSRGS